MQQSSMGCNFKLCESRTENQKRQQSTGQTTYHNLLYCTMANAGSLKPKVPRAAPTIQKYSALNFV